MSPEQTEMDWIPVEHELPCDTSRQSNLWLCLKNGQILRGGFIKATINNSPDTGDWFDDKGHAVEDVAYWLPIRTTQAPHPPIL